MRKDAHIFENKNSLAPARLFRSHFNTAFANITLQIWKCERILEIYFYRFCIFRDSKRAIELGKKAIELINELLVKTNISNICQAYQFQKVYYCNSSECLIKNIQVLRISIYEPEYPKGTYEVSVKANKPSEAEFKVFLFSLKVPKCYKNKQLQLFLLRNDDNLSISGLVDRLNKYGNNGNCAPYKYQPLCHCIK